jgi:hypothetical protein
MPRIGKCLVMEAGGRGGEAAVLLTVQPEAGQAARHAEVEAAAAAARIGPAQVFHPLRPFPPPPSYRGILLFLKKNIGHISTTKKIRKKCESGVLSFRPFFFVCLQEKFLNLLLDVGDLRLEL